MRKISLIFAGWIFALSMAAAQDAVPGEILSRTRFIKAGSEAGTGFVVDYEGKVYIITAKHVVAGLPTTNATLQVWQDETWKDYQTVRTLFPSSSDVDIAVFETNEKVPTPFGVRPADEIGGATMGQQVWFLGYPFGIESRFADDKRAPFIKRGTMSAVDGTKPDAVVIYVDGFNNPGFSGGPIVYWDFSKRVYGILGVVQGYREDAAKVLVNGQHVDTQILTNTGILVGYSIKHAMDAIKATNKTTAAK